MKKGLLILLLSLLSITVKAQDYNPYAGGWDSIAESALEFFQGLKPFIEKDFANDGFDMQFTPYYDGSKNKKLLIIYTLNTEVFESASEMESMLPSLKQDIIEMLQLAYKDNPDGYTIFHNFMLLGDGGINVIFESKINGSYIPKMTTITPDDL